MKKQAIILALGSGPVAGTVRVLAKTYSDSSIPNDFDEFFLPNDREQASNAFEKFEAWAHRTYQDASVGSPIRVYVLDLAFVGGLKHWRISVALPGSIQWVDLGSISKYLQGCIPKELTILLPECDAYEEAEVEEALKTTLDAITRLDEMQHRLHKIFKASVQIFQILETAEEKPAN